MLVGDLIEPVQDGKNQPTINKILGPACPGGGVAVFEEWVVAEELLNQPGPQPGRGGVPVAEAEQHRHWTGHTGVVGQVEDEAVSEHGLARTRAPQDDQPL